jgi:hypothetical protein
MMKRGILIFLLAAGTVLGFSFAFARHCAWHGGYGHHAWGGHGRGHLALEDRAADACVRAAERVLKERGPAAPVPAPPPAAAPSPLPAATP